MKQYQTKPLMVSAVHWLGGNVEEVQKFTANGFLNGSVGVICEGFDINFFTTEGSAKIDVGDWLVRSAQDKLLVCSPAIFAATYEEVETTPSPAE